MSNLEQKREHTVNLFNVEPSEMELKSIQSARNQERSKLNVTVQRRFSNKRRDSQLDSGMHESALLINGRSLSVVFGDV